MILAVLESRNLDLRDLAGFRVFLWTELDQFGRISDVLAGFFGQIQCSAELDGNGHIRIPLGGLNTMREFRKEHMLSMIFIL